MVMGSVLAFSTACSRPEQSVNTVAVIGRVPIIDTPDKPVLESLDPDELAEYNKLPESARAKLQANDRKLKVYAAQLRVGIDDYNVYAAVRNKTSDESVGVKK